MGKEVIDIKTKTEDKLFDVLNVFLSKLRQIYEGSINSLINLDKERSKLPEKIFLSNDDKRKKDKFYQNNMYLYNKFYQEQNRCNLNLRSNLIHSLNLLKGSAQMY